MQELPSFDELKRMAMRDPEGLEQLPRFTMSAPYRLELHPEDVLAISFVGTRYAWSSALLRFDCGVHELAAT